MRQDEMTLAPFYQGWDAYQAALVQAIAPLSEEQLCVARRPRAAPGVAAGGAHYRVAGE